MKAVLRPYQVRALDFLHKTPRANLFAGMGLGKTLTVETLVSELNSPDPTLVIAPLRVARKTWGDEAGEWDHLKGLTVSPIIGSPAQRSASLRNPAHIHTINYENIEWLMDQITSGRWPFRTVICDESTRLKSYRTRQGGRRARVLAAIASHATRWINLTGTPTANGLTDLWGPQWFIDYGAALGRSFNSFQNRWFYREAHTGLHGKLIAHRHAQAEIEALVKPTTLSIQARDWFDLQEPIRTIVSVELPPAARREYKRMARDLLAYLEGGTVISAANAAAKSTKLLQLASGACYHEDGSWSDVHDEKIEALRSIVNESGGAPLLVAYNYRHELVRILKAFPGARQLKTAKDEDDWNAGKIEMLVAHPDSAGHGINLQHGGNILVYFGHTWRLESYIQILERIGPTRQKQSGYDRPVFVYAIVARNTLDEAVIQRNAGKADLMDALMNNLRGET